MKKITFPIYGAFLAGILLMTLGCSDDRIASDARDAFVKYSAGRSIRIVFNLPGDDIGSKEDREILGKIGGAFTRDEIADIVRTEFGMGRMEIIVRARTELSSDSIDRIILAEYPKAKYRKEELQE
jgi:hypothetical protein